MNPLLFLLLVVLVNSQQNAPHFDVKTQTSIETYMALPEVVTIKVVVSDWDLPDKSTCGGIKTFVVSRYPSWFLGSFLLDSLETFLPGSTLHNRVFVINDARVSLVHRVPSTPEAIIEITSTLFKIREEKASERTDLHVCVSSSTCFETPNRCCTKTNGVVSCTEEVPHADAVTLTNGVIFLLVSFPVFLVPLFIVERWRGKPRKVMPNLVDQVLPSYMLRAKLTDPIGHAPNAIIFSGQYNISRIAFALVLISGCLCPLILFESLAGWRFISLPLLLFLSCSIGLSMVSFYLAWWAYKFFELLRAPHHLKTSLQFFLYAMFPPLGVLLCTGFFNYLLAFILIPGFPVLISLVIAILATLKALHVCFTGPFNAVLPEVISLQTARGVTVTWNQFYQICKGLGYTPKFQFLNTILLLGVFVLCGAILIPAGLILAPAITHDLFATLIAAYISKEVPETLGKLFTQRKGSRTSSFSDEVRTQFEAIFDPPPIPPLQVLNKVKVLIVKTIPIKGKTSTPQRSITRKFLKTPSKNNKTKTFEENVDDITISFDLDSEEQPITSEMELLALKI